MKHLLFLLILFPVFAFGQNYPSFVTQGMIDAERVRIKALIGLDDSLATKANTNHVHAYNSLTGIPATFAPSAHVHAYNTLTGLPALFDGDYNSLLNKPTIPTNTNQLTNGAGFLTAVSWGGITGTLSNQTDLINALNAKQATITNGSITNAQLANGAVANLSGTNTGDNATNTQYSGLAASKQDLITAGTTAQYWRGDKSFQTLDKAAVGLPLADNTSDASKPVSTAAQAALNLKANIASPAFTGPVTTTGSIGYAAGAGGTVTQATSKTTGVTLNKTSGQITMNGAALAAAAEVAFTLTNSTIASTDVVIVNIQSVGTAGSYFVTVGAVANGSCSITVGNASAASLSQAIVLNFAVIKSVNN